METVLVVVSCFACYTVTIERGEYMRYDDPEMSRIYEESLKANDYSSLGRAQASTQMKITDAPLHKDLQERMEKYSQKVKVLNAGNNEINKTAVNVLAIIALFILSLIFIGLPMLMGK